MKLTIVSVILLLTNLHVGPANSTSAQIEPANQSSQRRLGRAAQEPTDVEKLRAKFAQLDSYNGVENSKIETLVEGDTESSGKLTISVETTAETYIPLEKQIFEVDLSVLTIPDNFIIQTIAAIFSKQDATGSLEGVKVRQIGSTAEYEVVEDYTYQTTAYKITVPKGFVYDRASIPRIFWVLVDKDSLSNVAPLFHDLLYRYGGRLPQNQVSPYRTFSRDDADKLFLELMTKCGVIPWRKKAAYEAVRNLAGSHWNGQ